MSQQQTLNTFFKREPKRAREEEAAASSVTPATSQIQDIKRRVENINRTEKTHAKQERTPGESLGMKFDFAEPANLRDGRGRQPHDPDYDARTVLVPQEQYLKMTPFERQFWDVKRNLFDTVVFFRKGMFYELFEGDARMAQKEFGINFTLRASMVMVGFPATQFHQRAGQLLAKGYRVARVDQAESALGAEKRVRAGGREMEEKVIRRTVTEILTPGTLQDPQMAGGSAAPRFLSVWEGEGRVFGVCVVECATHSLWMGSFRDDARLSHLETLLLQTVPREAVLCKGACSPTALALVRARVGGGRHLVQMREQGDDFWPPDRARRALEGAFDTSKVPKLLQIATAGQGDQALLWAAGGALSYLEEIGVLAACLSSVKVAPFDALPLGHVALDGSTLVNLEILEGPACLLSLLDHTVTAQGARLFRQWCCAPLVDSERIAERLAATDVVRRNADWANQLRVDLKHVPDLERLAALCAVGTCGASKLAVLVLGMQRAWNALVTSLSANTSLRMPFQKGFDYEGVATALDQAATLSAASGAVLEGLLRLTRDWAAVKESGVLEPGPTVDEHADNTRAGLEEVKRALNELLRKAKEHLGTSDVAFVDVGKTRYLLDVPASARQRALNSGYKLINSTKQRDRFARKESEDLVDQLLELEDVMQGRCQSFLVLAQKHVVAASETVSELSRAVAEVDCLLSLAAFVDAHPGELCRPLVLARGQPWLEAVELKHPVCLKGGGTHIANNVSIGGGSAACLLVTGPNMGGKSTLLRSVCLAAVMAQIGCWVPCASFRMSAVDRIFTRIGARDDILAGQSTFMNEMLETSAVLNYATADSLVVLDELGRGTSTHDGHAIAYSVLSELERLGCRALFSTHYLSLAAEFADSPRVQRRMMSYIIDEEGKLVFLYKLVLGVTESSFGMNVARIAGIAPSIVARAETLAVDMQNLSMKEMFFVNLVKTIVKE